MALGDDSLKLRRFHGQPGQKPLNEVAAGLLDQFELGHGLHPFREDLNAQSPAEADNRFYDRGIVLVGGE